VAKRSAAYTKAKTFLQDSVDALALLYQTNPKIVQQHDILLAQKEEAEKDFKTAARAEAEKDSDFREESTANFSAKFIPTREGNVELFEQIVGRPPTEFDGLTTTKVTMAVDTLETLVAAHAVPEAALGAIRTKTFNIKLQYGEKQK
jgi:hypothetical protein